MSKICETPFGSYAPTYKERGFWARPLIGKACREKSWQLPDDELSEGLFESWLASKAEYNIGIVAGSPFPDGTRLGFLDIDHDKYTELGRVLFNNPACIRFGKKGAVIPFRYPSGLKVPHKEKLKVSNPEKEEVAELFFSNVYCAISPSIHPDTKSPYLWEGPSLHEIDYNLLPILGA